MAKRNYTKKSKTWKTKRGSQSKVIIKENSGISKRDLKLKTAEFKKDVELAKLKSKEYQKQLTRRSIAASATGGVVGTVSPSATAAASRVSAEQYTNAFSTGGISQEGEKDQSQQSGNKPNIKDEGWAG